MGLYPLGRDGVRDTSKIIAVHSQYRREKRSRNQTGTVPFLTNAPVAEGRSLAVVKNWYSPLAISSQVGRDYRNWFNVVYAPE